MAEEIAQKAMADGEAPLAYMLRIMNDPSVPTHRRDQMAVCAAQYCHPRLQALAIRNADQLPGPSSMPVISVVNIVSIPPGTHLTHEEITRLEQAPRLAARDGEIIDNDPINNNSPEEAA